MLPRLSLALTGLSLFLAAAEGKLAKRAPPFIESWPLYQYHDQITESIGEFDVPQVPGVEVGEFDKPSGVLTWLCYKVVLGAEIEKMESIIQKAQFGHQDGETPVTGAGTVVTKRSRSQRTMVVYGAKLQQGITHPNVLPIYHYLDAKDGAREFGWAVMPFVEGGSLEKNFAQYADQAAVNRGFKQILAAVAAVAGAGIMHRDLKPENFLKDGDTLKLMDFDQARKTDTSLQFDVGTRSYQAPEILAMKTDTVPEYTNKIDTFSIGMTFLVMSVAELQAEDKRFAVWKDLIEMDGALWPSADKVAEYLKKQNYPVFSGNDGLTRVIAKALCRPSERYTPGEFETAFNGAV